MNAIVVEERVALPVARPRPDRLVVVPRGRRRAGGWAPLDPDRVVEAIGAAGPGAVVLARDATADPGAAALPALARLMHRDLVRLPGDLAAAAWAIGVAVHPDFQAAAVVRRLEALVGSVPTGGPLPRLPIEEGGAAVPAVRPAVLSKWAASAWRACAKCPGGGPAGGCCGRCGAPVLAAA